MLEYYDKEDRCWVLFSNAVSNNRYVPYCVIYDYVHSWMRMTGHHMRHNENNCIRAFVMDLSKQEIGELIDQLDEYKDQSGDIVSDNNKSILETVHENVKELYNIGLIAEMEFSELVDLCSPNSSKLKQLMDKVKTLTEGVDVGDINQRLPDDNCEKCGMDWDEHDFGVPEPSCPNRK